MAREKRARASSSRSRAAPEPEPEPEPIAVEFDQNRYRNREAADRFSAQLSSPLTPGLRLDTPFLFNIGVLRCLQDCYLDRLTDRNTILYYPDAIRLFYANLTWNISSESCTLTSYVFGRRISFSQSRLATLLDLPDSGFSFSLDMIPVAGQSHWFDRPFSIEEQLRHTLHCRQVRVASKPSLRDLPPLSRLFHHIIAHNVIPRTGGLSLVSYLDVQLLTFFRSGTPLNLPRLIMLNMIRSASHPALAIPYGLLLTHILAAFDIPLLGEYIEVTRHIVLDCSTLRRKGLLDDRNRFLPEPELENVIVDDDDDDDDDEADDDGDDDDADGDDDAADADDDVGGDAGDGFDRDPPPLIIPSTHEAGTSSGPSTSGYEAILTRLDMMQQHMHAGFSRMDLAHSQLSRRLSRMEDHCGIQCPEEDIFHPPPPPSGSSRDVSTTPINTSRTYMLSSRPSFYQLVEGREGATRVPHFVLNYDLVTKGGKTSTKNDKATAYAFPKLHGFGSPTQIIDMGTQQAKDISDQKEDGRRKRLKTYIPCWGRKTPPSPKLRQEEETERDAEQS
ncbi:hypothetical protein RJ639_006733 [Escallonia herrerae]|uniref:Putative plant transposon protein domain-containing protein n=1 Tax=Escallonia herrerae TaxID=1293975 RepID=A0AA88VYM8_9ASTE|nr:hypothetical protein RJ639_006733 [Escallonia herrerae]